MHHFLIFGITWVSCIIHAESCSVDCDDKNICVDAIKGLGPSCDGLIDCAYECPIGSVPLLKTSSRSHISSSSNKNNKLLGIDIKIGLDLSSLESKTDSMSGETVDEIPSTISPPPLLPRLTTNANDNPGEVEIDETDIDTKKCFSDDDCPSYKPYCNSNKCTDCLRRKPRCCKCEKGKPCCREGPKSLLCIRPICKKTKQRTSVSHQKGVARRPPSEDHGGSY